MASAAKGVSSSTPKDSVAKQLLDSSAAVDVYFKGPETERSSDNLLCFPAEHTVYPMTVKTASNRFALKKRFSQFVTLDAQMRATFEGTASAGKLPELPAKAYLGSASPVLIQERKTKLESYMRTLVTVPEFRQCGPLLSFLDKAETETPSDKASSLAFWPAQCKKCGEGMMPGISCKRCTCAERRVIFI